MVALGLAGCAQLEPVAEALDLSQPTVEVAGVSITGLSFQRADLQFMLEVRNDNPVALEFAGLEYDFRIADQSIVSGEQDLVAGIGANAVSQVPLNVGLDYDVLEQAVGALLDQDELAYALTGQLGVKVPMLGRQVVRLSQAGQLPVPKLPRIRLLGMALGEVGLTSVEVNLAVMVDNPNAFAVAIGGLDFDLAVNEQPWGSAVTERTLQIAPKDQTQVTIPLDLEFARIGQSGFQLLVRRERFDYRLQGDAILDTDLPLLRDLRLPFDISGRGLSL